MPTILSNALGHMWSAPQLQRLPSQMSSFPGGNWSLVDALHFIILKALLSLQRAPFLQFDRVERTFTSLYSLEKLRPRGGGTRTSCCLRTSPHWLPQRLKYHNYALSSGFSTGPPLYSPLQKGEGGEGFFLLTLPSRLGGGEGAVRSSAWWMWTRTRYGRNSHGHQQSILTRPNNCPHPLP